jgi:hypothetical protein
VTGIEMTPTAELNDPPLENDDDLVAMLVRHRDQIRSGAALFS